MNKKLSILNLASVILVIAVNYISQVFTFNDTTIGEISSRYVNLFTPASYAFAIWGVIFLALLGYGIFQVYRAFFTNKKNLFIEQTGYWFILANILNCCWVFAFVYNYTGLSVLIMFGILISLIKIILNTNMERWDAPISTIAFVWWPICFYSGWISVATIANISAYLSKLNWNGGLLSEQAWTINMIVVAIVLNLLMVWKRNMREFALVGIWALFAIYSRHEGSNNSIAYTALIGCIILFIAISAHAFKNRKTSPAQKLQERLKQKP
ncbi:tryptophan-rich sensory protein [uncultured Maribacter sp.]|uniref:tryptophan-rich sensory protein n=1 Tax=uncultured Maribacter sp. TaxID=431308 RepID=UPI0030ED50D1|tara:strand:+ start:25511 stop:26314 length:804 start_codon:yes stop_codon:yes gene_type:complete